MNTLFSLPRRKLSSYELLKIIERRVFKPLHNPNRYFWITLNFKPEVEIQDCINLVESIVKYKFIKSYYYVYEQRREIELENTIFNKMGLHCHLLILTNHHKRYQYSAQIRSHIARTKKFSRCMYNTKDLFNIKTWDINKFNYHKDKIDYIIGKNKNKEKHQKQMIDDVFRKTNNFKDFYTNDLNYLKMK